MVGIAQLVERLVVVQEVAGSSPVTHPNAARGGLGISAQWPDLAEFEQMVIDQLDALPDPMVEGLDNVVFLVEESPEHPEDVLGIYEGVALTERGDYGYGELPDRIVLYRTPLIAKSDSIETLRQEIHITLVHEIAHYYGIDDEQLHALGWG